MTFPICGARQYSGSASFCTRCDKNHGPRSSGATCLPAGLDAIPKPSSGVRSRKSQESGYRGDEATRLLRSTIGALAG